MSDALAQPGAELEAVIAAIKAGDMTLAKQRAGQALAGGLEHPLLLNLRALEFEEVENFAAALADLRRAHFLAPQDFAILNACGLCLARMEQNDEALQCFDQALAIRPDFGPAWFNRASALERLGGKVEAAKSYLRATEINPENGQAWANLAHLAARRADVESTRRYADRALAVQPGHPTAILALANVELSEPETAERRLLDLIARDPLTQFDRALAFSQLGDVLDIQNRPAEAFEAYETGNHLFRQEAAPRFEAPGQPTVSDTLAWLTAWLQSLEQGRWRAKSGTSSGHGDAAGHVFLIGFPRSGTTLIESILGGHPNVVALEERNTLDASVLAFLGDARAAARLETVGDYELEPYRADYWARVKRYGANPKGKIFIDKNPFNTMKLPLITRLFPKAKIIFSLRDPRDVVLSCFRRQFNFNASTYEFLDLQRAARFYDGAMRIADLFKAIQPFDEYTLVYERLVEDFPAQAEAVCTFIGADWRPELLDFSARARRGDVASASSAQIARGLYTDGAGQWRRYKTQLAPVLPVLKPWVEHFGYPAD